LPALRRFAPGRTARSFPLDAIKARSGGLVNIVLNPDR
jgi:hypothetical protein